MDFLLRVINVAIENNHETAAHTKVYKTHVS